MSVNPTQGWLPVEISFDYVPALIPEASVRWMEFGSEPLAEPFFSHTVDRLRASVPPPMELDLSIAETLRISRLLPPIQPSGFIFHISHCGSTLVANALKTIPDLVVSSESIPLGRLLRLYPTAPGRYLNERFEQNRFELVDAMFRLMAHYRTGKPERLVLKFPSFSLPAMDLVCSRWPSVPCVIMVREPLEVVVSVLRDSNWLGLKAHPNAARELFGLEESAQSLLDMSIDEFCARVLARYLKSSLRHLNENCRVVDYQDLTSERIREIAAFFGIEMPPEKRALDRILASYSKDPAQAIPFTQDTGQKRAAASRATREAAEKWARPLYSELRSRSRGLEPV